MAYLRLLLQVLLLLPVCLSFPAAADEDKTRPGVIDSDYRIPDLGTEAAQFLNRAQALAARLQALRKENREIEEAAAVDDVLYGLYLPANPARFSDAYRIELRLAGTPQAFSAWRDAATALFAARRETESSVAAYGAFRRAVSDQQRAQALDLMAEAMLSGGRHRDGTNLLYQALKLSQAPARRARYAAVLARYELRVVDVAIDVEGARASACIVFSGKLARPLPIPAADYLRFEAPQDFNIRATDNRICITGLAHGAQYRVTVRAGLPGRQGGRLFGDVERRISVPDRAARISLGSRTYVLPRTGVANVPLKTVNTRAVKLALYLVPDRGLVPYLSTGSLGNDVSGHQEDWLRTHQGTAMWSGRVDIADRPNVEVTTLIPVRDVLKDERPGVYALVATDAGRPQQAERHRQWEPRATQWLIVTDIGLTSISGAGGLHVFARSLAEAEAMAKVRLKLVARNNEILAEAETDVLGHARFPPAITGGTGGAAPVLVAAETGRGDYAILRLDTAGFDLSDRGVSGRLPPDGLDGFLYPERGVYRPGETVHLTALLRDARAEAVARTPLTLVITRPDGVEAKRATKTGDDLGGYGWTYPLTPAARSGRWRASLIAGDETTAIGSASFQVEDFVPERLAVTVAAADSFFDPDRGLGLDLQADFLYGAPAAGLTGAVSLKLETDPVPYPGFAEYRFGLVQDSFRSPHAQKVDFTTDGAGAAHVLARLDGVPDTSQPLRARLVAEVRGVSGRPVFAVTRVPVRLRDYEIGVRADRHGRFGETDTAGFDILTVSPDGAAKGGQALVLTWVKEHYSYNWYRTGSRWRYRALVTDEVVAEEQKSTDKAGRLAVTRHLPPGRYRLDVVSAAGRGAATSMRFQVGWWSGAASPEVPDELELALETTTLAAGDRLRGFVQAPFAGRAMIAVVSDRLHQLQEIELTKSGSRFELEVRAEWAPSAYVLVTGYRPNAGAVSRFPVRVMGIANFSVDRFRREAGLTIDAPEVVAPRQRV